MDPVYFAHGYRAREAPFAAHFGSLMQRVGFIPSLDPPSNDVNAAKLERHLSYTNGLIAVIANRPEGPSPHILFEISMCMRARKPLLVFIEDTLPDNLVSSHILQKRYSARSYIREIREHMHSLEIFRTYVGDRPTPRYQGNIHQRSCVLLGVKVLKEEYYDQIKTLLNERGYRIILIDFEQGSVVQPGNVHYEIASANLAICCVDDKNPITNYLLGVVQEALVPSILLTVNESSPLNPEIPNEYQRRLIPSTYSEEGIEIIRRQIELFEEDFIELDKEGKAEKYAQALAMTASPIGDYSQSMRTHIIQEVTMGDKYITSGQVGAVGPSSHAHDMSFTQVWNQTSKDIDLSTLAQELSILRQHLRAEAQTPEQDLAIGAVANAELAAKTGDGPKALEWLKKAGSWAFDAATRIGTDVAIAALKAALGI
ncbi:MAG: hypothetical protein ACOZFS_05870 [Thermodesulfobacteriota bacterium]